MSRKNIILMYISEISGHHSATLAIEKGIKMLSDEAEVLNINAFHYTNPISEMIVNRIYTTIIKKTPKIWDYVYDNPKIKNKIEKFQESLHKLNSPKFKKLFDRFQPDAVVCTQAFPCGMVADYKKTYNSKLPLIAVLTDYVPHSYWIYDNVNYYITPSEEVSQRLIKKGVPSYKIKSFGIPFDPAFNEPADKNSIKENLKLDPDLKTILIMGGGQGLGPIKAIVKSLDKVKSEIQEIIITGTNKKLYNSLKKKIKEYKKKILLYGYINNVNELMSISDIVITKPGGITTSEALAKRIPLIIVKPIPGQEMNNTVYLMDQRAAIKIDKPKLTNEVIEDLLSNPEKLKRLSESAGRIARPNATLDIARFILEK
jgi:processive 1,2-diacylglycerol beta-glucosyltransferase